MSHQIIIGDCLESLRVMPACSVDCCVTSPPYFGLRDYGMDGQLGLESTPDEFVTAMVEVFREVRRVLRDNGTLWLNLGDSYAGSWGNQGRKKERGTQREINGEMMQKVGDGRYPSTGSNTGKIRTEGVKLKDLYGIPWRVAFALQADGWYLRQDIIWHKPNPMPESVRDRCTKAHEYIFLLSKGPRYYYDNEAIKEPVAASSIARLAQNVAAQAGSDRVPGKTNGPMKAVRAKRDSFKREGSKREQIFPGQRAGTHRPDRAESSYSLDMRNKRSVWTVTTKPFKGAHFATFPPDLIVPCILAGCPPDGTVLDPFGGAGTTSVVAEQAGRNSILCELNPDYAALAQTRIEQAQFRSISEEPAEHQLTLPLATA